MVMYHGVAVTECSVVRAVSAEEMAEVMKGVMEKWRCEAAGLEKGFKRR
jgi:hypothetical protein